MASPNNHTEKEEQEQNETGMGAESPREDSLSELENPSRNDDRLSADGVAEEKDGLRTSVEERKATDGADCSSTLDSECDLGERKPDKKQERVVMGDEETHPNSPQPTNNETNEVLNTLPDPVIVNQFVARDVLEFLLNYPDNRDDFSFNSNVSFFNNELRLRPGGLLIDEFHNYAPRRFRLLEEHHGYLS